MIETQAGPPSPTALPLGSLTPTTPGVGCLTTLFVNLYTVDLPDGGWVLVDTGLPGFAWYVRQAVANRHGAESRPRAIVLTHGHFDHAGSALELAEAWDVPVYAHSLELPYLTGRSDYAPQDPTPGGAMCFLSRFFPRSGIDLGSRVHPLPDDGSIPPLPGWRWVRTPGHTSGHVSLFEEAHATLIAGDVVATTDLDAWSTQFTWPREISRPPTPFTPDWENARQSIRRIAGLNPRTVAAGHGLPIEGGNLGEALARFAEALEEPPGGRYAGHPAHYLPDGSLGAVPPPVPDPLPKNLLVGAAVAGLAIGLVAMLGKHRGPRHPLG